MTFKHNRSLPKKYHDPYGDEESDALSLPTHIAVITMSRVIRLFLKKKSGFVVAFVLPPGGDFNAYQRAAAFLLEGTLPLTKDEGYNYVVPVLDEDDLHDGFAAFRKLKRIRRALILVTQKKLLTDEVRLAADVVAELPSPSADDYRIAARAMGFGNLSDADVHARLDVEGKLGDDRIAGPELVGICCFELIPTPFAEPLFLQDGF
jgi:cell division protease FtsH